MFARKFALAAAVIITTAGVSSARAAIETPPNDLLFSNIGDLRYNCWIGRTVTGPTNPARNNGYQAHAFYFTPTMTETLGSVFAPLLADSYTTDKTLNAITVTLTATKNIGVDSLVGVPDENNILDQWSVSNLPLQTVTDGVVVARTVKYQTLYSATHPLLQAGTGYWLIGTAPGNAIMDWNTALADDIPYIPTGSTGFVGVSTIAPSDNVPSTQIPTVWVTSGPNSQQGAFRIYGTTVVPEVSALPLLATGLIALGVVRRRRRA